MNIPSVIYSIVFCPCIILVGVATIYQDIVYSKIRNGWVVFGIVYAILVYAIVFALRGFFFSDQGAFIYAIITYKFSFWCINLVLSVCAAYLLWSSKIWGAGDAKLFICYAALIPMGQYHRVYFDYYFASFALLAAIFIPPTVFILVKSTVYFLKRVKEGFSSQGFRLTGSGILSLNIKTFFSIALGFFTIFFTAKLLNLNRLFGVDTSFERNIVFIVSLLLFSKLSVYFKKRPVFLAIILLIAVWFRFFVEKLTFQKLFIEVQNSILFSFIIISVFPFVQKLADKYIQRTEKKGGPFAHWIFLGVIIIWFF